jgi:hypothetical protein
VHSFSPGRLSAEIDDTSGNQILIAVLISNMTISSAVFKGDLSFLSSTSIQSSFPLNSLHVDVNRSMVSLRRESSIMTGGADPAGQDDRKSSIAFGWNHEHQMIVILAVSRFLVRNLSLLRTADMV